MNTNFLYGPVANALGWTLLHAVWQGFALVLPAAVALHVLRHRSGALRYNIGALTLLTQVLVSVATFGWYYQPVAAQLSSTGLVVGTRSLTTYWPAVASPLLWHQQAGQFLGNHLGQLVLLYLIGVGVFALRLVGGWLFVQRLTRAAHLPKSGNWTNQIEQVRTTLRIRQTVRIRESARVAVPMVVGILKPVVLWPVSLSTGLTTAEIEAVLAHELAHVKRHDYAVNLLQSVVEVLYFFHPALWWLSARVREEREHACDDLALRALGGNGSVLARALARVEALRMEQAAAPSLAMAFSSRQLLLHRVRRMLGVATQPVVSNGHLAGLTLATLLLVSVSVYAVQPTPPKPAKRPHSTVRYKAGNKTEFGLSDGRTIDYVVWKGQPLPASRVARLQQAWNQTMTGRLNLDDVAQPDRDVLLEIIEKQYAVKSDMGALKGLDRIDSDNTLNTTLLNLPDQLDGTLTELKKTNFDSLATNDLSNVPLLRPLSDSLKRTLAQRKLDSLTTTINTVMKARKEAIDRITKEMADLTLKSTDFQKQQLLQGQAGLISQQARLAAEIARLSLRTDARSRTLLRQNEQKLARLEKELQSRTKQLEKQVEQQQRQMLASSAYTDRLSALGDSMSRLMEPVTALSEQIGELSGQIAEDAMRQAEQAMRLVDEVNVNVNVPVTPRAPRIPRAPRTLRGMVKPMPPVAPVPPANVPVRPKTAPRSVPNVAPMPPKP